MQKAKNKPRLHLLLCEVTVNALSLLSNVFLQLLPPHSYLDTGLQNQSQEQDLSVLAVLFSLMRYLHHIWFWPRCYLLMCFFSCFTPQLFGPIHSTSRTSLVNTVLSLCHFPQLSPFPVIWTLLDCIEIKCCRR